MGITLFSVFADTWSDSSCVCKSCKSLYILCTYNNCTKDFAALDRWWFGFFKFCCSVIISSSFVTLLALRMSSVTPQNKSVVCWVFKLQTYGIFIVMDRVQSQHVRITDIALYRWNVIAISVWSIWVNSCFIYAVMGITLFCLCRYLVYCLCTFRYWDLGRTNSL